MTIGLNAINKILILSKMNYHKHISTPLSIASLKTPPTLSLRILLFPMYTLLRPLFGCLLMKFFNPYTAFSVSLLLVTISV